MTDTEKHVEAVARAMCEHRCGVAEYSVWDESLGAVDKEESMFEARAGILETLRQIREPGDGALLVGSQEAGSRDPRYESSRDAVGNCWEAMIDHLIAEIGND